MTAATLHKELGCWIGAIRGSKQKQLEEEFTVNQLVTERDTFKEASSSEVKVDRVHQSAENCRFRIMFLTVNMSSRTVMMELIHSSACHPHMQDKAPLCREEARCGVGLHQRTSSVSWKQSQDWPERDTGPLPNVQQPLSSAHTCLQTVVKRRQEAAQWWTWPCPPLLLPAHS